MSLEIGDIAPDFELPDTELKMRTLDEFKGEKIVLSFIVAASSPVCEVELCTFRDSWKEISELGVNVNYNIDEVIEWADAVNILRIQRERMGIGLIPSNREYRRLFGVTYERISRRDKELVIMHPGPMNRGVEIDSEVADSDQAIILEQVLNGVASRMSILYLLLGAKEEVENEN